MSRRVISLDDGVAMVVTDLHGAWDVYCRLRDLFLQQHQKGDVQTLVFCGDLIHAEEGNGVDNSLEILLDIMNLQAALGPQRVVMLLGNHEIPHIYGMSLSKGTTQYTPPFEAALARLDQFYESKYRRKDVIDFLISLPFFAWTKGGVLLTHAGASNEVPSPTAFERLINIDHHKMLVMADEELNKYDIEALRRGYTHFTGLPYESQAKQFLGVTDPSNPRYNDLLRELFLPGKSSDFDLMWNTLFSQNEYDGDNTYQSTVTNFLRYASRVSPYELRVIVAGHISVKNGFGQVGPHQLRLASYTHAIPRETGRYLLLDCARSANVATDLIAGIKPVFPDGVIA